LPPKIITSEASREEFPWDRLQLSPNIPHKKFLLLKFSDAAENKTIGFAFVDTRGPANLILFDFVPESKNIYPISDFTMEISKFLINQKKIDETPFSWLTVGPSPTLTSGDVITASSISNLNQIRIEKKEIVDELKSATGDDIFKNLLQLKLNSLEEYINLTRFQAQQTFNLSRNISIIGFGLLSLGIILSIIGNYYGLKILDTAYLAAISGIIIEFISGVFFAFYNRTLQQINLFHNKLIESQNIAIALVTNDQIEDPNKRDDCKFELAKILLTNNQDKF